jgi:hypothetical protein
LLIVGRELLLCVTSRILAISAIVVGLGATLYITMGIIYLVNGLSSN